MRWSVLVLLIAAACASDRISDNVVGPFTGEARRYVVDRIILPTTIAQADELGGGLVGDGPQNQLGGVISTLYVQGDVTSHGDDLINAGLISSSVIVTADDFDDDDSVSVRYLASDDDLTGVVVGGRLSEGAFYPNRTRYTRVPGAATVRLPVFVDADPSTVRVEGVEILLAPDGAGGFDAELHGVVEDVLAAAAPGVMQMIEARPYDHLMLKKLLDGDQDGVITEQEFTTNPLMRSLVAPDITHDGKKVLSFGFGLHLRPCAEGTCQTPVVSCFNHVLDGDEVQLDCGGGCRGCAEGATCNAPADCESLDCDAGACGPPSCTNGVRDGYETDLDCGGECASNCASGQRCLTDLDCASGQCGEPCDPDGWFCGGGWNYEICR